MELQAPLAILKKLEILTDAAKYDVACTSSGVDRKGQPGSMGNAVSGGICHSFAADGRCISLLKILYTNECVFDCKYCVNRSSNDVPRASFTPEEIAELTISFYRRNYIEGLFLSSGIRKNPNFTMEQIYEALRLIRHQYHFNGYIHIKAIPGVDPLLIEKVGWLADRMSVNLELPTAAGLRELAPHKTRKTILGPMRQIQVQRDQDREFHGELPYHKRTNAIGRNRDAGGGAALEAKPRDALEAKPRDALEAKLQAALPSAHDVDEGASARLNAPIERRQSTALAKPSPNARFVPAGQSTQVIVGATGESDYEIVHVAEALYQRFDLKRVFYSAFVNPSIQAPSRSSIYSDLPMALDGPPLLREHRLYQADWLLRFYGFQATEILTPDHPHLNVQIDPKCNWAVNHLEYFPVEVQTANYKTLLRVPGIGPKSASRIVAARKTAKLDYPDLKKFGVVLKRAMYFILCNGKSMTSHQMGERFILNNLLGLKETLPARITGDTLYEQLSLFD